MENILKAWLVDNAVTVDNKEDKILLPETAGNATLPDIYRLMKAEDTGLREETIRHVTDLFQRVVTRLVLSGYQVNTGLFYATPQLRGVVEQGKWNPEKNSIYVSITQGKQLREAIAKTRVQILGEKTHGMYIAGSEDAATRAGDGSCTPGRNYVLNGRMLKVMGTDPEVGITLTPESGTPIKLSADMIAVNNPSQLIILLPADLAKGTYELKVTTQFAGGGKALKTPRSVSKLITVNDGDGTTDEPENPFG
ncbi:MAG: DNA-binding domain-containing protein [Bacteroides sp.]|uniref:DNA-binding domain-containing protein n=1 Tax=Bacteroides sp. TaxID=29523 RepID=UPI002FCAC3E5|nr:DUF4469 domain-containing protein [Bacteroides sp.]